MIKDILDQKKVTEISNAFEESIEGERIVMITILNEEATLYLMESGYGMIRYSNGAFKIINPILAQAEILSTNQGTQQYAMANKKTAKMLDIIQKANQETQARENNKKEEQPDGSNTPTNS